MKTTLKKLLSVLLCVAIISSMFTFAIPASAESVSGTCGDELTWTFDTESGTLTIDGTGEMDNYNAKSGTPWYDYRESIASVVIGEEVYTIGNYAFYNCTSLVEITLPDGLYSIGNSAFLGCTALTAMVVPESLEDIGSSVFYDCDNLTLYVVEGSLAHEYAVDNVLPFDIIGDNSNLKRGACGDNLTWTLDLYYNALTIRGEGDMYDYYLEAPWYEWREIITRIIICDGVTSIGDCAFSGATVLTDITIPAGVTRIGDSAFDGCPALTSVVIPDEVTYIGEAAFRGCSALTEISIPENVTAIGHDAFMNCASLTSLFLGKNINSLGNTVFDGCDNLVLQVLDGTTAHRYAIDNSIPFEVLGGADSVVGTCGDDLTWVYDLDTGTLTIDGTGEMDNYNTKSGTPWYDYRESITSVVIGEEVYTIGNYAFYNCTSLVEITLPDGLYSIGSYAFRGCTALTAMVVPESLENIRSSAFKECDNLTLYVVEGSLAHEYAVDNAIPYEIIESEGGNEGGDEPETNVVGGQCGDNVYWALDLDTGLLNISGDGEMEEYVGQSEHFAYYAEYIKTVNIEYGVNYIGDCAFQDCTEITEITLPETVVSIGERAFDGCKALLSLNIPKATHTISESAFSGCTMLTLGVYPKSTGHWYAINSGEHYYFTETVISDSVGENVYWELNLDNGALLIYGDGEMEGYVGQSEHFAYWAEFIQYVNIEDGVNYIGDCAFQNCISLAELIIPESVKSIGGYAFQSCTSLAELAIPESVISIGEQAFYNCPNLTLKVYGESAAHQYAIDNEIPYELIGGGDVGGENIVSGQCGENVYWALDLDTGALTISGNGEIEQYDGQEEHFSYWADYIYNVTIENGIDYIEYCAFQNYTNLHEIIIPESVTYITDLFYDCVNLTLKVYENSYAHQYAIDNEIPYELIDGGDVGGENIVSGVYGENATWTLDLDTGLFTVDGYGGHNYWEPDMIVPWKQYAEYITKAVIGEGITDVGPGAFTGCTALTEVVIPDTVTQIISWAFTGCSSLESITIPGSVTMIGMDAFCNCTALSEVVLNEGLETISSYAFANCTSLKNLTIPKSVTTIYDGGSDAFEGCSNMTFRVYNFSEGHRYAQQSGCVSAFEIIDAEQEPETVKSGYCGEGVEWTLNLETGFLRISGSGEMYDFPDACPWDEWDSFVYEAVIEDGVTSIGSEAFGDMKSLTRVTVADSVTTINESAFYNCESLAEVIIGRGVTYIHERAFISCRYNIVLGVYENSYAHQYAVDMGIRYSINGDVGELVSGQCGDNVIWELDTVTGVLTVSGSGAMYDFWDGRPWEGYIHLIDSVIISDGVTNIGGRAFYGAQSLSGISIGSSVTTISGAAFGYCSALESVYIPGNVDMIGGGAFSDCASLRDVVIEEGVISMGECAFAVCPSLTELVIPESVTDLSDRGVFHSSDNLTLKVYEGSAGHQHAIDFGIAYELIGGGDVGGENTVSGQCGDNVYWELNLDTGDFTLSGTGDMYSYWWDNPAPWADYLNSIKTVYVSESITSVGDYAFKDCVNLEEISFASSMNYVGHSVFQGCTSLKEVYLPDGITQIGGMAFYGCTSLEYVDIPESVTTICDDAFRDCVSLISLTLPENLNVICVGVFQGCDSLTVKVYDGSWAHQYAVNRGIPYELIGGDVGGENIVGGQCGDNVYWELDLDNGALLIYGEGAMFDYFYDAPWTDYTSYVSSITIIDGVTYIGNYTFMNCNNLTEVNIPDSVTSIGADAFAGCRSLVEINIPDSVTFIGDFAFPSCTSLTKINIPYGVTYIGEQAFYNCDSLKEITLPETVASIGFYAFADCDSLAEINIPNSMTYIGEGAFAYCYSLTELTIPESVTGFGYAAFHECTSLVLKVYSNSAALEYAIRYSIAYELIEKAEGIPGDVNGDGGLNISDFFTLKNALLAGDYYAEADINGDGNLNISDLFALKQLLRG